MYVFITKYAYGKKFREYTVDKILNLRSDVKTRNFGIAPAQSNFTTNNTLIIMPRGILEIKRYTLHKNAKKTVIGNILSIAVGSSTDLSPDSHV